MKLRSLFCGLFVLAAAVACKQDEPVEEAPKLDVSKTSVELAAKAGSASFDVTSNQAWTASPDADWVSLEPASGAASEKAVTVKVTAEENTAETARTAKVTVKAGEFTKTVTVTQAAAEATEPEPEPEVKTYILVGEAVGGWNVDQNGVVLTLADGYYTAKEVNVTAQKGMHFTMNNKWEGNIKGLHGLIAPNEIGEVGNNDISLTEGGAFDVYLTEALDKFYFMTPGKTPAEAVEHVEIATVWGVCGAIDGNSWGTAADPVLAEEGEWLVAKGINFTEVNFKVRGNNSWSDDVKWGCATANQTCELNAAIAVSTCTEFKAANPDAGDNPNIYIAADAGAYDIYFSPEKKEVWVMTPGLKPGEKPAEPVEPVTTGVIWENDGTVGAAAWSGSPYRFSIVGGDANNECCAEIPADIWAGMKLAPFFVEVQPATAETEWWQIRVLDGWWTNNDESGASDINPQSEGLVNNGDGTYTFQVDLASNPELVALIDTQHLLFAGDGFIINKIYFGTTNEGGNEGGEDTFDGEMLTTLYYATEQYDQYKQAIVVAGTPGVTATQDPQTYQTVYSGTGKILNLTMNAEKGDAGVYIPAGEYVAGPDTNSPFTWQVTGGMPEYNAYWGTYITDVVDGVPTIVELTEGTCTVEVEGENYTLTFESGDYKLRYTGPLTPLVVPAE